STRSPDRSTGRLDLRPPPPWLGRDSYFVDREPAPWRRRRLENADVARQLAEMADILELTGGNPFKVRAYRAAAQVIDTLPEPVAELWRRDALTTLPSIGAGIATEIGELLATGRSAKHDQLAQEVP